MPFAFAAEHTTIFSIVFQSTRRNERYNSTCRFGLSNFEIRSRSVGRLIELVEGGWWVVGSYIEIGSRRHGMHTSTTAALTPPALRLLRRRRLLLAVDADTSAY